MNIPDNRVTPHPGILLLHEFLEPLGLTQAEFARHLGVPTQRINEIVRGKRGLSAETAWMFSKAFGTSVELWRNLQFAYEMSLLKQTKGLPEIECINPHAEPDTGEHPDEQSS